MCMFNCWLVHVLVIYLVGCLGWVAHVSTDADIHGRPACAVGLLVCWFVISIVDWSVWLAGWLMGLALKSLTGRFGL